MTAEYISTGNSNPDLGGNSTSSKGMNVFLNNDNSDYGYQVANYTFGAISAQCNYWGYTTAAEIDAHIYDDDESSSFGEVVFEPWLSEDPSDQLPKPPVGLTQLEFDEVTEIPVGGATDEQVVLFRGEVSDPDGDMVLLQIELRRLEELGGEFDEGDASGLRRSDLVESSSEAIVYAENLIPDHYHWAKWVEKPVTRPLPR